MTVLDQQFKQRLALQTDIETVLAIADYAREQGAEIPLSGENFGVLMSFVEEFDIGEDIFAEIESRIARLKKAAPVLFLSLNNPLAFLASPIFGVELSQEDAEAIQNLPRLDGLTALLLSTFMSKSSRVIAAYAAALDGSFKELKEILQEDEVYAEIFGPDARELKWAQAVAELFDYNNLLPLAEIIEPGVDPVLAKYYISCPESDQRYVIDATLEALFKRKPEALKELLRRSGYTISRLPRAKNTAK